MAKNFLRNFQVSKAPKKPGNGPTYKTGDFRKYNPKKYVGDPGKITYRSGYELKFFLKMEANNNVAGWASEQIVIPYLMKEKVDGKLVDKRHNYVTDCTVFLKDGSKYIIEIKPLAFSPTESNKNNLTMMQYKNMQKWRYAMQWCRQNGYIFKVVTEVHLNTKIF